MYGKLFASRNPQRCASLVLLAPAFALARRWAERMDPAALTRWRADGEVLVDHYAWGTREPLSLGFLTEAAGYDDFPLPQAPTLVLQGKSDEVVEPSLAREFTARMQAAGRAVTHVELDDGHELNRDLPALSLHLERHLGFAAERGA